MMSNTSNDLLGAVDVSESKLNSGSPSGSATGNPRNKTSLKPGHSLMDWIRLGHSGQDLTGVGGASRTVTPEELAKHDTLTDCWLALRGTVYNVTHYMDFHPGGSYQLMKGAGMDATEMFDEVHAYVNYSSILQKCIVGRLKPSNTPRPTVTNISELSLTDSDTVVAFKLPSTQMSDTSFKIPVTPTGSLTSVLLPLDWYQKEDSINIIFYTKVPNPGVEVFLKNRHVSVHIKVGSRVVLSKFTLTNKVKWPCAIQISDIGKVDIEFIKLESAMWNTYGSPCEGSVLTSPQDETWELKVVDSIAVSYNTKLIVLRHGGQFYNWVPIGHHLLVHYRDEVVNLVRMYTPVPPHLHPDFRLTNWTADCVCLMIKEYVTGKVTPWICNLKPGDVVNMSGPEGLFRTQMVKHCTHLYMVAAGTGITPMLGLIPWVLEGKKKKCTSVNLLFFNRSEADILWREQLERLMETNERFSVTHVLSAPEADWKGASGHVDKEMLESFLDDAAAETTEQKRQFIAICGPTRFTQITREFLQKLGYQNDQFHCFVG